MNTPQFKTRNAPFVYVEYYRVQNKECSLWGYQSGQLRPITLFIVWSATYVKLGMNGKLKTNAPFVAIT